MPFLPRLFCWLLVAGFLAVPNSLPRAQETSLSPLAEWEATWPVDVRIAVQEGLAWAGHYTGMLDGDLGQLSRRGIEAYQAARGHDITGWLTPHEIDDLLAAARDARSELQFSPVFDPATGITVALPRSGFSSLIAPDGVPGTSMSVAFDGRASVMLIRLDGISDWRWEDLHSHFQADFAGAGARLDYDFFRPNRMSLWHSEGGSVQTLFAIRQGGRVRGFIWWLDNRAAGELMPVTTLAASYFDPFSQGGIQLARLDPPVPPAHLTQQESRLDQFGRDEFFVVVASANTEARALYLAEDYRRRGLPASVGWSTAGAYAVVLGPYGRAMADRMLASWTRDGLIGADSFIRRADELSVPPSDEVAEGEPSDRLPDQLRPSSPALPSISSGSGFLINARGHIATNDHVVDGCSSLTVQAPGETPVDAAVVARDAATDLAVLRTSLRTDSFARLRTAPSPRLAEPVMVAGYPLSDILGDGISITNGSVSALSGIGGSLAEFRITAPVQPGNSGGPVLDTNGDVIGVTVATLNDGSDFRAQNVNFAVRAGVLEALLSAHSIPHELNVGGEARLPIEAAAAAQRWVVFITCY